MTLGIIRPFAIVSIRGGDDEVQKCIRFLNRTKWKGHNLQLQVAKEYYCNRLARERVETANIIAEKAKREIEGIVRLAEYKPPHFAEESCGVLRIRRNRYLNKKLNIVYCGAASTIPPVKKVVVGALSEHIQYDESNRAVHRLATRWATDNEVTAYLQQTSLPENDSIVDATNVNAGNGSSSSEPPQCWVCGEETPTSASSSSVDKSSKMTMTMPSSANVRHDGGGLRKGFGTLLSISERAVVAAAVAVQQTSSVPEPLAGTDDEEDAPRCVLPSEVTEDALASENDRLFSILSSVLSKSKESSAVASTKSLANSKQTAIPLASSSSASGANLSELKSIFKREVFFSLQVLLLLMMMMI